MSGPHPDPLALDAHLEPSALMAGFDVREPIVSSLSIAVSLKRIADALTQCDQYGQTGSAAIAQAIVDGFREAR